MEQPETGNNNWKQPLTLLTYKCEDNQKVKARSAFKLNFQKEKKTCYELQKSFLSRCKYEKIIPNQVRIDLEPSIGNLDEEFTNKWYEHLQVFSLSSMSETV